MSKPKLKPCPFCGRAAHMVKVQTPSIGTRYRVGCDNPLCPVMPAISGSRSTRREAAAAWNRRAERACSQVLPGVRKKAGGGMIADDGRREATRRPCPLCGRGMVAIETHMGRGELYCGECDVTIGGNEAKLPEEPDALLAMAPDRGALLALAEELGSMPYSINILTKVQPRDAARRIREACKVEEES